MKKGSFGGLTREEFQRLVDSPCAQPLRTYAINVKTHGIRGGYAAQPGTGPAGETCKSCKHYTHVMHARAYRKCGLMREFWTGGPGSDIKASSPACERWERP